MSKTDPPINQLYFKEKKIILKTASRWRNSVKKDHIRVLFYRIYMSIRKNMSAEGKKGSELQTIAAFYIQMFL